LKKNHTKPGWLLRWSTTQGLHRDMLMRLKDDADQTQYDTNLKAVPEMSRAVLRTMMKQRYASSTSSPLWSGLLQRWSVFNYAAAKAGVMRRPARSRRELGLATSIASLSGFTETDMTAWVKPGGPAKTLLSVIPQGIWANSSRYCTRRLSFWQALKPTSQARKSRFTHGMYMNLLLNHSRPF
jgi:3-oxoacyl-[acyl-carrier protein] reductase